MPTPVAPTVLIVGGGFAGRAAYLALRRSTPQAHIVLVDDKPFFEFTPSVLRCLVRPAHLRRVTFPHDDGHLAFVLGTVTHITDAEATVARPEQGRFVMLAVPYDYCVFAAGVSFDRPIKSAVPGVPSVVRRVAEMSYFQDQLVAATEILIIGGGLVGVELAAEIAAVIRDDTVRLTLAAPSLLPRLPARAGVYAKDWLVKRKVRIVTARLTAEPVLPNGQHEYRDHQTGFSLKADTVFNCTGAKSNGAASALIAGGMCDQSSINRDGSINVLDTLQLPGSPHFFVAGDIARVRNELDINTLACEKTAYAAQEAGILAARNVAVLIQSEALARRKPGVLHRFPNDIFPNGVFPRMFVVSLYKYHGILCAGPVVITGWFPALVKVVVEFLGVRTAKSSGFAATVFRALEAIMFYVTVTLVVLWQRFRPRSAD